ncbi:exo-alpha-sialidase [Sphingobacterium sp. DK4209]|uniref:Exo-alpha-sialidase n=1 Tax=Sphingobacterium zhuxiongii TaxID=2662364 RepID=A0A5Q0QC22_9SPHI|nr:MULTISPECIES: sialidase family protein [unclassified Sphingobacterium]MVZ64709.1 exo-alpha-sialidase [Sphingobacterium sp. DK4209]QGA27046.1 exo-alpha-sialidase [Sphingobacterium sp. dk4302]
MKKHFFAICLAVCSLSFAGTADAQAQQVPHLKNNVVLKLAPSQTNPRNSEGSFVTLKDGSILFVYSHYTSGNGGDHDPAYLASRISKDGGKTWTASDERVLNNEGGMNVMSVSLLRLKNGEIAMFYLRKNTTDDCIPYVRFSKDEAKTWSDPIACIQDKQGYFVLNNDRVIQLKNGRLLMAVAWHKNLNSEMSGNGNLFSYYSDDNGRTWKAGSEALAPKGIITQEPGVVELKNGDIMMFIRATGGKQLVSYSKDKGQSWTAAVAYNLDSPLSPASIERIPSTGDLFAIWNNNDGSNKETKGERTPLTIAISKDDGKTWQKVKNIEIDPDGWYCYMGIHFDKKNVLLSYCAGSQSERSHLNVTDIALLSLKDIYK